MNRKHLIVLITVVGLLVCVGVVYAVNSLGTAKPEFHVFNLEYVNNSQTNLPDLITFNIQNLGPVLATNVKVDFVFNIQSDLVAGREFTYTYTYTRDVLQSKEVRDGAVSCGPSEIDQRYNFWNATNFLPDDDALQVWEEMQSTYEQLQTFAPLDPEKLTHFEKEALIYWSGLWSLSTTPSHYVISCAEGIVETEPFPF